MLQYCLADLMASDEHPLVHSWEEDDKLIRNSFQLGSSSLDKPWWLAQLILSVPTY
jgi:hypothetical protein